MTIYDYAEALCRIAGTSMRNALRVQYFVSNLAAFPGVAMAWSTKMGAQPHPFVCIQTPPAMPAPGLVLIADFWISTLLNTSPARQSRAYICPTMQPPVAQRRDQYWFPNPGVRAHLLPGLLSDGGVAVARHLRHRRHLAPAGQGRLQRRLAIIDV